MAPPSSLGEIPPVTISPAPPLARAAKKRRHALKTVRGFFQTSVHGPHQDPVFQRCEAKIKWLKKFWKFVCHVVPASRYPVTG